VLIAIAPSYRVKEFPMIKLAPSILAADFARLGEQVRAAEAAGADWIHLDVMDGHFVPNISIGFPIVQAVRAVTILPLDVHLMIEGPERFLSEFVRLGANRITVHVETCPHLHRTLQQINELGCKNGVALNPGTPLAALDELLPELDLVLVMSVNPGFGGQDYLPASTGKIARMRRRLDEIGSEAELQVDGGVNTDTIATVARAGATVLVAGSAVFNDQAPVSDNIQQLRALCQ
jgi:ribulose-phosphate 3-epimerase